MLYLHELLRGGGPVCQQLCGDAGPGLRHELLQRGLEEAEVLRRLHRHQVHHRLVAATLEPLLRVEDVSDAPRHARGEVPAGGAEDDHAASSHVLTAVVPAPLNHRCHAGITDTEPEQV